MRGATELFHRPRPARSASRCKPSAPANTDHVIKKRLEKHFDFRVWGDHPRLQPAPSAGDRQLRVLPETGRARAVGQVLWRIALGEDRPRRGAALGVERRSLRRFRRYDSSGGTAITPPYGPTALRPYGPGRRLTAPRLCARRRRAQWAIAGIAPECTRPIGCAEERSASFAPLVLMRLLSSAHPIELAHYPVWTKPTRPSPSSGSNTALAGPLGPNGLSMAGPQGLRMSPTQ